ncbi:putative DNA repair helicase [Trypanosoma grayi]|uniref:putative DNA repair helicase n=1 Tax=Trypanosoma grayi TaxID=71804 RepID=UPI0004F41F1F|nr:putative DNA repair helicase [Trypanosoma grayi]KEG15546.1 putative DNA repair helicase [Trypanosoma grayi]
MYDAGPFRVPFPFEPYPLQLHAMAAIRGGLAAGDVVVLESPTGTGKTQVLLNSVLSHIFEPVIAAQVEDAKPSQQPQQHQLPTGERAEATPEVGRGQKRQREHRGYRKRGRRGVANAPDEQDAFLVEQDAGEEAGERSLYTAVMSSSSSSACSSLVNSDDEEENGEEDTVWQALRKPKVYFSSRTHTQLQQLNEELHRTVFAQHPVRRRPHVVIGEKQTASPDEEPHTLRYVHVAGRQHLCLNASVKAAAGGSNERLNELCLEAMKYEYSKEGRAARKLQRSQGSSLRDIEDNIFAGNSGNGCGYCQRERLNILRDYVDIAPRQLSEMRDLGRRVGACPFLVTREMIRGADVVLIPYSYLVSPEMRHALLAGTATNEHATAEMEEENEEARSPSAVVTASSSHVHRPRKKAPPLPPCFSDDVIVVDEAHNIVEYCRSATSAALTATDLSLVRALLNGYNTRYEERLLTRNKQRIREMVAFVDKLVHYVKEKSSTTAESSNFGANVCDFSSFLFDAGVDTVNVYRFLAFLSESRLLPKLHGLVAFLSLNEEQQQQRQQSQKQRHIRAAITKWTEGNETDKSCISNKSNNKPDNDQGESAFLSLVRDRMAVTSALRRFDSFLQWYARSDECTRVVLRRSAIEKGKKEKEGAPMLQLLQLEPGTHTLFPVLQQAQAAVLAGGTMKPLALTCDPLFKQTNSLSCKTHAGDANSKDVVAGEEEQRQAPAVKKVRFTEEGHVVPSSSFAVFALGVGPSGQRVELQHTTRGQWQRHFEEVGAALLNFSRVIPAGMIVFFTSYEMQDLFVALLQSSGLYDKINAVKRVFREPGRVTASSTTTAAAAAGGGSGGGGGVSSEANTVDAMLEEYAGWIRAGGTGGAMLLAVMGGKLSEGINFNDDLGRAVIVVGLPYANPSDVELQLYLKHIARTRLETPSPSRAASTAGTSGVALSADADVVGDDALMPFSSPAQWGLFTDLCMRSVNQSIGRCIRHAGDYAVVILMDVRYGERADVRRRIASWMHPSVRVAHNFGECFRGVRDFFVSRRQQQQQKH